MSFQKCPKCNGEGQVYNEYSSSRFNTCPLCLGEFVIHEEQGVPPSKAMAIITYMPFIKTKSDKEAAILKFEHDLNTRIRAFIDAQDDGEVSIQSFYDEEGIDGWRWHWKNREWQVVGVHHEPPEPPEEVRNMVLLEVFDLYFEMKNDQLLYPKDQI